MNTYFVLCVCYVYDYHKRFAPLRLARFARFASVQGLHSTHSLAVFGVYFLLFKHCFVQNWVPRIPGPSQKLSLIKLCRFPNGELLASHWCRNRLVHPESQLAMQKRWFCVSCGGGHAPAPLRRKNEGLRNADPVYVVLGLCVLGMGVHAPPWLRRKTMVLCPWDGGAFPPPGCDAKPWLCVAV